MIKIKHKSSHHDKEKHKSHHHDKEKHKSSHHHHHHDKPHKPKSSSLLSAAKDASDISRMLAEPIDREIDGDDFQISERKPIKDGQPITPPSKRKRTRTADGKFYFK